MALIDMLTKATGTYSSTDPAWVQCVRDHKDWLLSQSQTQVITAPYFQQVKYNLQRYLNLYGYDISCTWIIGLLNNIPNDVAFNTAQSLQIPPITVIESLYTTYQASSQNISR